MILISSLYFISLKIILDYLFIYRYYNLKNLLTVQVVSFGEIWASVQQLVWTVMSNNSHSKNFERRKFKNSIRFIYFFSLPNVTSNTIYYKLHSWTTYKYFSFLYAFINIMLFKNNNIKNAMLAWTKYNSNK